MRDWVVRQAGQTLELAQSRRLAAAEHTAHAGPPRCIPEGSARPNGAHLFRRKAKFCIASTQPRICFQASIQSPNQHSSAPPWTTAPCRLTLRATCTSRSSRGSSRSGMAEALRRRTRSRAGAGASGDKGDTKRCSPRSGAWVTFSPDCGADGALRPPLLPGADRLQVLAAERRQVHAGRRVRLPAHVRRGQDTRLPGLCEDGDVLGAPAHPVLAPHGARRPSSTAPERRTAPLSSLATCASAASAGLRGTRR